MSTRRLSKPGAAIACALLSMSMLQAAASASTQTLGASINKSGWGITGSTTLDAKTALFAEYDLGGSAVVPTTHGPAVVSASLFKVGLRYALDDHIAESGPFVDVHAGLMPITYVDSDGYAYQVSATNVGGGVGLRARLSDSLFLIGEGTLESVSAGEESETGFVLSAGLEMQL